MKKSREELEKECAEATAKAEQYQHQVQRLENRYHDYQESKRKKRNHRLITRGADVESVATEVRGMKRSGSHKDFRSLTVVIYTCLFLFDIYSVMTSTHL